MIQNISSLIDHLECSDCGKSLPPDKLAGLCDCGAPLLVKYRLEPGCFRRESLAGRRPGVWKYREVLPAAIPVTLGEGGTPLLPTPRLARSLGLKHLWVKEESRNPTGSFKARGLGLAVTMAHHFSVPGLAIPTAGNAGSALAAYAAAAEIPAHVYLPRDTPPLCKWEAASYGAVVHEVEGTIKDCGAAMREPAQREGWFDVSTLKEPYRIEGKKTMGYEIAEQMNWKLPDWIFYPTGGGTGLIGMVKAFSEMETLGWIGSHRPRMVAVQATGCAPIVRALELGHERAEAWENAHTAAWGLRVPAPLGDALILRGIRDTGGTAVAVSEEEMARSATLLARQEGIDACPEGGATVAALARLVQRGDLHPEARVVLFNTGSGLKYVDNPKWAT